MKIIKQFFWIVLFAVIGDVVATLIPLPIPGSVYGLIIFFIALHWKILPMEKVDTVGSWLTSNMAIMFVPAGVGTINYLSNLAENWWQLPLIIVVSTIILIIVIAWVTDRLSDYEETQEGEEN